jgi:hypothetical protein
MQTGELAIEGLTRVGLEVRDKCGARMGVATTKARGPFTGVLGSVHANVICGGRVRKINIRGGTRKRKLEGKSGAPSCMWRMNVFKSSKASLQSAH